MEIVNEKIIDSPIPIIDGKVTIEIPEWGCRIVAKVKQVKGRGTADADKLTKLNESHKTLLKLLKDFGWEEFSAKQMKTIVEGHFKSKGIAIDPNHYNRTISELVRKCLFIFDNNKRPPKYILNHSKIDKALASGEFGQ